MIVVTSSGILGRIAMAAEGAYPEECCGLLVGRRTEAAVQIDEAAASTNIAGERRRRFEVDPTLRLSLMRTLRGTGRDIVGHYHSHPDGPDEPSAQDAAMAFEPDLIWLVVAVLRGRATAPGAFRFDADAGVFRGLRLATCSRG